VRTAQVSAALQEYAEESDDDVEAVAEGIIEFLRKLVGMPIAAGDSLVLNSLIECLDEVIDDIE
jgi:hypothetical protein